MACNGGSECAVVSGGNGETLPNGGGAASGDDAGATNVEAGGVGEGTSVGPGRAAGD